MSAEALFDLLKKEFADDVNAKLDSSLTIEFAHVYDIINIAFPEIIEGSVFTLTVTDDAIEVSNNGDNTAYNTELLEQQLIAFLNEKCS